MKCNIALILILYFLTNNLNAQSSFEASGFKMNTPSTFSLLNSFEKNPGNFSSIRDWGFTFSYYGEMGNEYSGGPNLISIFKDFDNWNLSLRYTPGYEKQFRFSRGEAIVEDTSTISLQSDLTYKEIAGAGFSYKFNNLLNAGFSLRYFSENFNNEKIGAVFADTFYLIRENEIEKNDYVRLDISATYSFTDNFLFSLSVFDLFRLNQKQLSDEGETYSLRQKRNFVAGIDYSNYVFNSSLRIESIGAFHLGFGKSFNIYDNTLLISNDLFKYENDSKLVSGIIPAITFGNRLYSFSLSYVHYFNNKYQSASYEEFIDEGLFNINNNKYSRNKAQLSFSIALNTKQEKKVELLDVEIINNIYPTLNELYINQPFAIGKVVNISNQTVTIKPYSFIDGINNENIYSPFVLALPGDTVEIPFYTFIKEDYEEKKISFSVANFYVTTINESFDDKLQKGILINGINGWNGNVIDLRFFVYKDYNFSLTYSKNVLSNFKNVLDTIPNELLTFYKTKLIFNSFAKEMNYVSDPRATAEYVQFPFETMNLKGGDCDDLSVLFSSLLESIGIETAFIDYKEENGIRHVALIVNTNLKTEQAFYITNNDTKYHLRKNNNNEDEVWIPIETTILTTFEEAWENGASRFYEEAILNLGLIKNKIEIIEIY